MNSDSGPGRTEQLGPRFLFLSLIAIIAAAPLMVAGHLAASLLLLVVLTGYNTLLYLYPGANRSFRDGKYVPPFFIFFITMFAAWAVAFHRFDEPANPVPTFAPNLKQMGLSVEGVEPGFTSEQVLDRLGKPDSEFWHTVVDSHLPIGYWQGEDVLDMLRELRAKEGRLQGYPDEKALQALRSEWAKANARIPHKRNSSVSLDAALTQFKGKLQDDPGQILVEVTEEPVSHWLLDNTADYASKHSYGIILSTDLEEGYVGVAGRLVRRKAWRYEEIDTVVVFSDKEPGLVHAVVGSSLFVGGKVWLRSGDPVGRIKTLSEQLRTSSSKRLIWDYRLTEFDFRVEINEEEGAIQRMRLTRLP